MCRSIRTLRPPFAEDVTDDDVRAAALQYVRKISGFRAPSAANDAAFEAAVAAVAGATRDLLAGLQVRPTATRPDLTTSARGRSPRTVPTAAVGSDVTTDDGKRSGRPRRETMAARATTREESPARATNGEASAARAATREASPARATTREASPARATNGEASAARAATRDASAARASRPETTAAGPATARSAAAETAARRAVSRGGG